MDRVGILTSGGDAPAMNAAIRALVRTSKKTKMIGIEGGYEGLIEGNFVDLSKGSVGDILHRGGTILKTSRSERFKTPDGIEQAIRSISKRSINALVVLGGDGTFRGAKDLIDQGISVIGIPCTIDNDMGFTDYTIGFDTAVNTVLDAISKIRDTASSHDRTTIIEVMGRHCGDIACYTGITGGADYILIPERELDLKEMCQKIRRGKDRGKKHSIIIKAEGVPITTAKLAKIINKQTGEEPRIVVLSYLQRGGSPTAKDRMLASLMAVKTMELLDRNHVNKAIGIVAGQIIHMPLAQAINISREVDLEMLELIDRLAQ